MTSFADLEKCIQANISPQSNDIRIKAEGHLKELKSKHPQQFFEGISELISASKNVNVRSFSAVLLKQNLGIFDETFGKIPLNSQNKIKNVLLNQLKMEKDQNVIIQIAEGISYLACRDHQNEHNDWNELMPFLLKLATSSNEYERGSFYITIDKLACNSIDILRLNNNKNMENFKNILISGLNDKNKIVQEAALNAIVSLLCGLSEMNELNYFIDIVPLLFKNINNNNNK
mmetsp:Transcript_50817/g.45606  ORF Transcript_50817/g.45606 Transcript_50817/m.45606 type:complete len:231 (-) Transcript_50817:13-705(-)